MAFANEKKSVRHVCNIRILLVKLLGWLSGFFCRISLPVSCQTRLLATETVDLIARGKAWFSRLKQLGIVTIRAPFQRPQLVQLGIAQPANANRSLGSDHLDSSLRLACLGFLARFERGIFRLLLLCCTTSVFFRT